MTIAEVISKHFTYNYFPDQIELVPIHPQRCETYVIEISKCPGGVRYDLYRQSNNETSIQEDIEDHEIFMCRDRRRVWHIVKDRRSLVEQFHNVISNAGLNFDP